MVHIAIAKLQIPVNNSLYLDYKLTNRLELDQNWSSCKLYKLIYERHIHETEEI